MRSLCEIPASGAQGLRAPDACPAATSSANVTTRSRGSRDGSDLLDLLATLEPPAFAVDDEQRIVFWNRGAERVLGRNAVQVLGRHCYEVLAARDLFGNRYCHAVCPVVARRRRGEVEVGFEVVDVKSAHEADERVGVTIVTIPGCRAGLWTMLHLLSPLEPESRLARALAGGERWEQEPNSASRVPRATLIQDASLTAREREVLGWVAAGLQNKQIARTLDISVATVRNHVHHLLEKIGVHSKLEAVSLCFRRGWVTNRAEHRE